MQVSAKTIMPCFGFSPDSRGTKCERLYYEVKRARNCSKKANWASLLNKSTCTEAVFSEQPENRLTRGPNCKPCQNRSLNTFGGQYKQPAIKMV